MDFGERNYEVVKTEIA